MGETDAVLRFWFDELPPKAWWNADAHVDRTVRERFGRSYDALVADPPPVESLDAHGHLAAVIVFDQFARHLFRGTARAFASDDLALAVTEHALARRLDRVLPPVRRHFLYMPLMHREDLVVQRRALALFAGLKDPRASRSARRHHDEIERFGRFPSRNAALGRASTDDERRYLARPRSREPARLAGQPE